MMPSERAPSWADYVPMLGNVVFVLSALLFTLLTGVLWYLQGLLLGGEFSDGAGATQVGSILTTGMAATSALALASLLLGLQWRRWWSTRELAEGSGGALLAVFLFGWVGAVFLMIGLGLVSAGLYTTWQGSVPFFMHQRMAPTGRLNAYATSQ